MHHCIDALAAAAPAAGEAGSAPAAVAWAVFCGFLILFMQAGFALVGTGLGRAKNAAHTMSMTLLAFALGLTGFAACGFALMRGGASAPYTSPNPAMLTPGFKGFFLSGVTTPAGLAWFLLTAGAVNVAVTIPAGTLAERWRFKSFFFFSLLLGALIYPLYGRWVWGGGWLARLGASAGLGHGVVDYAGSSVVHLQAGAVALVCSWLLGPRLGKYDERGNPRPILGHHVPMVMLGTLVLAFGWFGFNTGRSFAAGDGRFPVIAVNTLMAAAASALAAAGYMWLVFGKPDPSVMCNGLLGGLVAISASCAFVAPWAAFLIGLVAGVLAVLSVLFWEQRGIDDPVGAISVHGVNGAWGMIALALLGDGSAGDGYNGIAGPVRGLLYGGGARQLLCQLIAVGVCVIWSVLVGGAAFALLGRLLRSNRVSPEVEIAGLDIPEMGAPGYPEFTSHIAPESVTLSEITAAR